MAFAIVRGLLASGHEPDRLVIANRSEAALERFRDLGIAAVGTDNAAAAAGADLLVLAVKPVQMGAVAGELAPVLSRDTVVMTVAAGVPMSRYEAWFGADRAIVRCMPNTPSTVGVGAAGLFANRTCPAAGRALAEAVMSASGLALWVDDEALLDAVIAVSGSGPAYFFAFMEAMMATGEALGLDPVTSRQLTLQTARGAAELACAEPVDVGELRRRVTSPGGTTAAALAALETGDLAGLVEGAMRAAVSRAQAMAEEFD